MKLHLYPWELEIDQEKTRAYYQKFDLTEDQTLNKALKSILDTQTLAFIEEFGVNFERIRVKRLSPISGQAYGKQVPSYSYSIGFFFAGQLIAIPSTQWDFYFKADEDGPAIFALEAPMPKRVIVTDEEFAYQSAHLKGDYRFSPGAAYDDKLTSWHSGLVYCKGLLKE